jgi:hypothetical protein
MKRQQLAPEIAAHVERQLSLDEYARRRSVPISDDDVAETMALVSWFRRRYPTVKERFAYVTRKYAEWTSRPPVRPR